MFRCMRGALGPGGGDGGIGIYVLRLNFLVREGEFGVFMIIKVVETADLEVVISATVGWGSCFPVSVREMKMTDRCMLFTSTI